MRRTSGTSASRNCNATWATPGITTNDLAARQASWTAALYWAMVTRASLQLQALAYTRRHANVTAVGFEPTPLRTGALSQRLRPLGQTVLTARIMCYAVVRNFLQRPCQMAISGSSSPCFGGRPLGFSGGSRLPEGQEAAAG